MGIYMHTQWELIYKQWDFLPCYGARVLCRDCVNLDGKRDKERPREKMLESLSPWPVGTAVSEIIGSTGVRRLGQQDRQPFTAWTVRRTC